VPSGDDEECQRSARSGEGSPRSDKVQEEFASPGTEKVPSRGAPGHARLKLAAANSSVDPPPSWLRE